MSRPTTAFALALAALFAGASAQAATFEVFAQANSSSGGTGLATIGLLAGESFSVDVATTDLWSAGALPRWSNADGLTAPTFASGSDESGEAAGTQIGANFGLWSQGNLSAAYGTLVGQIDSGDFFAIGTSYAGTAASAGTLKLFYWDSNNGDNAGSIQASVVGAIPEPETYALMLAGLAGVGFVARRRRA